jgi:hypothetical protein
VLAIGGTTHMRPHASSISSDMQAMCRGLSRPMIPTPVFPPREGGRTRCSDAACIWDILSQRDQMSMSAENGEIWGSMSNARPLEGRKQRPWRFSWAVSPASDSPPADIQPPASAPPC